MYTYEQEREEALFFESQPYNAFQAADAEAHYLFRAGFTTYCSCNSCELAAEADAQEQEDRYHFDYETSVADLEETAQYLFDLSASECALQFAPSDPALPEGF